MKLLEKFVLIIYSFFMLIISAVICLLIFNVIDMDTIRIWIDFLTQNQSATIIALGTSVICFLLSIRCLFFRKRKEIRKSDATDILLENDSGKLLISKSAIDNAVKNIISDVMEKEPETKVVVDIDPASNLNIYISIMIENEIKVKDLSVGLQLKIKEKIKEDFDLEVKQVNIKIDSLPQKNNSKNNKENKQEKLAISNEEKNMIEVKKSTVD